MEEDLFQDSFPSMSEAFLATVPGLAMEELGEATMAAMGEVGEAMGRSPVPGGGGGAPLHSSTPTGGARGGALGTPRREATSTAALRPAGFVSARSLVTRGLGRAGGGELAVTRGLAGAGGGGLLTPRGSKNIVGETEVNGKEETVVKAKGEVAKEGIEVQIVKEDIQQKMAEEKTEVKEEQLLMSAWGLPECVVEAYREKGITAMFTWQAECLLATPTAGAGPLQGGNLVYSAPTSAGKTLVAELLMMKRVFETGKKALLILPFVSLAREKMFHLQSLLRDSGIRVEGFMGASAPAGGLEVTDIAVATIEKANSLVNRMMEEKTVEKLTCVVVDELHMLGDSSRGYLLELLLTKLLYTAGAKVQVVGMSATLPNLRDLSGWLRAALYTTDFRPVPLTELLKVEDTLLDTAMRPMAVVRPAVTIPGDPDHITWLCLETILESHSVLVFCPIKAWVEKLALTLAEHLMALGRPDPTDRDRVTVDIRQRLSEQLSGERLGEVMSQLHSSPAGLDSTLKKALRSGVAYHHAGLTTEERDIVEAGFKSGAVRVLVATSTLSSGVNLPARRVILRCPLTYNKQLMDKLQYRQMVGRAGRKGIDTRGESILLCQPAEKERVAGLLGGEVEPVTSCLGHTGGATTGAMKRAILEVVVSGAAASREEVRRYGECTLLAAQLRNEGQQGVIEECVTFLEQAEFIRLQEVGEEREVRFVASRLGLACLAASLGPDESLLVYKELSRARRNFVLENELHIIYLIVPMRGGMSWPSLDWMAFLTMWENLSEDMKRVGSLVGVEERWMVRAMRGTLRMANPEQQRSLAIHQRFYTALALHDLVGEVSLSEVAARYGANKGNLQSLQQQAATFAGMVTVFCQRLGWSNLELLVGQFQHRLEFGIKRELTDLCRLAAMDGARARLLFDAGIESVAVLAATKAEDVENVILAGTAFGAAERGERRRSRSVFVQGRPAMTEEECARLVVAEARAVMARDLGLRPDAWDSQPRAGPGVTPAAGRKRRRGSASPAPAPSPHLTYQLQAAAPSLTHHLHRQAVSPGLPAKKASVSPEPPQKKQAVSPSPPAKRRAFQQISPENSITKVATSRKHEPEKKKEVAEQDKVARENGRIEETLKVEARKEQARKEEARKEEIRKEDARKEEVRQEEARKEEARKEEARIEEAKKEEAKKVKVYRASVVREKDVKESKAEELKGPLVLEPKPAPSSREPGQGSPSSLATMSFDMSSMLFSEEEGAEAGGGKEEEGRQGEREARRKSSSRKRVSWGDASAEGGLVETKVMSQNMFESCDEEEWTTQTKEEVVEEQEEQAKEVVEEALSTPERSYMPETPRVAVCSEELSLHWSDSGGEGEDVFNQGQEQVEDKAEVKEQEELDMFRGDTMSGSMVNFFMDEGEGAEVNSVEVMNKVEAARKVEVKVNPVEKLSKVKVVRRLQEVEVSVGLLEAVGELDTVVQFSPSPRQEVQRSGRRRKGVRRGGRVRSTKSPGMVLSDSEGELPTQPPPTQRSSHTRPSLPPPSSHLPPPASQLPVELPELCVVDVCSSRLLLATFLEEWRGREEFGLAVAVERAGEGRGRAEVEVEVGQVVGLAVSWSGLDVYYITLVEGARVEDSLCPATQEEGLEVAEVLEEVGRVLGSTTATVTAMGWRQQAGLVYQLTGLLVGGRARDPGGAAWLLDPTAAPATIARLVVEHAPALLPLLHTLGSGPGTGSVATNPAATMPARQRAVAEAVLVRRLMPPLEDALAAAGLTKHFHEVEMGVEVVLAGMEHTGMGINEAEFEDVKLLLQARLRIVEDATYRAAGRHFSLTSPAEVCQVLFREMRLPVNGDPKLSLASVRAGKQGVKLSSNKEVLERLVRRGHAIAELVLEHRRLTHALGSTVAPLLAACRHHPALGPRLYPVSVTHSATGRVSLHEPSLQNIPRDFQLVLTEELKAAALGRRAGRRRRRNSSSLALSPLLRLLGPPDTAAATVSLRHAIVPADGNLLLSADYSQVELRMLAHLSGDAALLAIFRQDGDVFCTLAAELNSTTVEQVTVEQRQQAKQTVYGMVYGMGERTLAEQLGVEAPVAAAFQERFRAQFPGLRVWLTGCVTAARRTGCVETMAGRRRKLPDIAATSHHRRQAAERVAVNTRVQGSVADLVKGAMVRVERALAAAWPDRRPLKWCRGRRAWGGRGAWLALQLHDELIYEVHGEDVVQVAQIVREGMEGAATLAVPTPVRVQVGATWGSLRTFQL